jgi:hypothetical protein
VCSFYPRNNTKRTKHGLSDCLQQPVPSLHTRHPFRRLWVPTPKHVWCTTYLVLLTTHFSTGKTLSRLFPERNHNLFVTAAVVARWKTSTNDVMDCPCKSAVLTLPKWESVECVGRFHDWLVVGHRNANISLTHIQNSRERPSVVPAHRFTFFAF